MDFDRKIKEVLEELGLTELQIRFYLTLLKSGGLGITKAAKLLGINRTNSYNILEKLKSLNLIWEENRPSGKVVFAKSYESLLEALNQRESQISDFKNSLESLAPIFKSFTANSNIPEGPKIKVYEGKKGLNVMVDDILDQTRPGKEILLYTNQKSIKRVFNQKKHNEFVKQRIANNISIKVLSINNDEGYELKATDKNNLRETRILPSTFSFDSEIYIYENKISMLDIKSDIIGVIIESEELYKIHKQMFEFLWQISS